MRQYYYVIYFDEETKKWIHVIDTESIRFDTGAIVRTNWNEEVGKWDVEDANKWKVDALLNDGLHFLNNISAVRHLVGEV